MKVVATYSIKGGVGKTTTAVNLSFEAASSEHACCSGTSTPRAATFFFRVKPKVKGGVARLLGHHGGLAANVKESDVGGLHVRPTSRVIDPPRRREVRRPACRPDRALADDYDVGADCAPGITLGSEAVFRAADVLLVPTVPTTLSVRTLDQLTDFLDGDDKAPEVLPFVSMLDRRKTLHRELVGSLAEVEPRSWQRRSPTPASSSAWRCGAPRSVRWLRAAARKAFAGLLVGGRPAPVVDPIRVFGAIGVPRGTLPGASHSDDLKHSDRSAVVDQRHGGGDEAEEHQGRRPRW